MLAGAVASERPLDRAQTLSGLVIAMMESDGLPIIETSLRGVVAVLRPPTADTFGAMGALRALRSPRALGDEASGAVSLSRSKV